MSGRRIRRPIRSIPLLLVFAIAVLAPARAEAHAILLETSPAIGSIIAIPPEKIDLLFSERVTLGRAPIRLAVAASGARLPLGRARQLDGDRLVSVSLQRVDRQVRGVVVVHWSVISDDGDPVSGEFQFAIGSGHPGALRGPTLADTLPAPQRIAAQWLTIGGIALAILGVWVALTTAAVRSTRFTVCGGVLAALGRVLLLAELAAGSSLHTALASRAGLAATLAAVCFAGSAATVRVAWLARQLLILGVFATAAGGHGPTVAPFVIGTLVFGLHLLAGSAWLATLGGVLLISLRRNTLERGIVATALRQYVKLAAACVAALIASGLAMAWLLVGSLSAFTSTTDGRLVIAKSAFLQAALLIALHQRQRLARFLERGLGRLAGLEWLLLGAAALVGGVMADTLPGSSEAAARRISQPVEVAIGPAIRLAGLAGRYTVFLAARGRSIELTVLGLDGKPLGSEHVALTLDPGGTLTTRTCGAGCRLATTRLNSGGTQATVSVHDSQGSSSTARFAIPWPPTPEAAQLLRRVVDRLRQQPQVGLRESTTSNGNAKASPRLAASRSGRTLAEQLLLLPDGAIDAHLIGRRVEHGQRLRVLTFFLPGALVWHQLEITDDEQILRDTWVNPRHLIVDEIQPR